MFFVNSHSLCFTLFVDVSRMKICLVLFVFIALGRQTDRQRFYFILFLYEMTLDEQNISQNKTPEIL